MHYTHVDPLALRPAYRETLVNFCVLDFPTLPSTTDTDMIRSALLTTAVLLATAAQSQAQSSQPFELVFNQGPLAGQSFPGQFEVTPGDGIKFPDDGSLLGISTTVGGLSFNELDDLDFPGFPEVDIFGGQVVYVDAFLDKSGPNGGGVLSILVEQGVGNSVSFSPDSSQPSFGYFRFPGVSIPDAGSTAILFGLGMGGLAWARRRSA
jgi:hypothetical protein